MNALRTESDLLVLSLARMRLHHTFQDSPPPHTHTHTHTHTYILAFAIGNKGMSQDDFLGWAEKGLSDIPASGVTESLKLHRRSAHSHVGGAVDVSVSFFSRAMRLSATFADSEAAELAASHARDDLDRCVMSALPAITPMRSCREIRNADALSIAVVA
jgi:hypothetical protein